MEKLIELLNEFEKVREKSEYQKLSHKEYKWFSSYFFPLCFGHKEDFSGAMTNEFGEGTEEVICGKKFGFIKWLVENEKIDPGTRNPLFITELVGEQEKQMPYSFYEEMLIRLALSDTPIEDLISYLK